MLTDEDFHKAIDRIARTGDGRILYHFLQKRLMGLAAVSGQSALLEDHGERRFASQLIGLMAKGIEESGSITGDTGTERPITFAVAGPRAVSRRAGSRLIDADTSVPGYADPGA